jgi:2-amino-4-hydroxy-6-hydroxymethyldihydropteridine diphosphokinase
LEPRALLAALHQIERAAGRRADSHERPRPLDLDIVLYGDQRVDLPDLVVPHPRAGERRFVLQPLADLGVLASRPEWRLRLRELEPVQALRAAGTLGPEEWRAESIA